MRIRTIRNTKKNDYPTRSSLRARRGSSFSARAPGDCWAGSRERSGRDGLTSAFPLRVQTDAAAVGSLNAETAARVFVPVAESVAGASVPSVVFCLRRHCVAPAAGGLFPASAAVSGDPAPALRIASAAVADTFGRVWGFLCLAPQSEDGVEGPWRRWEGEERCSRDWP